MLDDPPMICQIMTIDRDLSVLRVRRLEICAIRHIMHSCTRLMLIHLFAQAKQWVLAQFLLMLQSGALRPSQSPLLAVVNHRRR